MADLGTALQSVLQVPGLQELLNSSITQQRQKAPLHTAVNQQAMNMLPNSAFGAGGRTDISSIPSAGYTTPAPTDSGTDWAKVLGGIGAGVGVGGLLAKLLGGSGGGSGASGNLASIVNALKKLFASRGGTVQGNKPGPGGIGPTTNPYDPFQGWAPNPNDNGMNYDNWPGNGSPNPNVDSDWFTGPWPETNRPFDPFDPSMLPGSGTGRPDDPYGVP